MFFFNRKKNKQVDEVEENKSEEQVEEIEQEAAKEEKEEAGTLEKALGGIALFKDTLFDFEVIRNNIKRMAGVDIEIMENTENPSFMVKTEEGTFICTHIPTPMPHGEVFADLKFNSVEPQTVQDIQNHQAFIAIGRADEPFKDRVKACLMFTKIASALMIQPNAAAMYLSDLRYILSPQRYYAFMGQILEKEREGECFFPYPLWIKTNLFRTEKGIKAVTNGLGEFGLYELGFEETKRSPEEIFNVIMGLCDMYLGEKCQFQDGDTMKLDQNTKATFKLEGQTLMIIEE